MSLPGDTPSRPECRPKDCWLGHLHFLATSGSDCGATCAHEAAAWRRQNCMTRGRTDHRLSSQRNDASTWLMTAWQGRHRGPRLRQQSLRQLTEEAAYRQSGGSAPRSTCATPCHASCPSRSTRFNCVDARAIVRYRSGHLLGLVHSTSANLIQVQRDCYQGRIHTSRPLAGAVDGSSCSIMHQC